MIPAWTIPTWAPTIGKSHGHYCAAHDHEWACRVARCPKPWTCICADEDAHAF